MSNIIPKLGLGLIFCFLLFIPIIGITVILGLSNICIWLMFAIIIIFTASLSDESALGLMDSFSDDDLPTKKGKQCSFCGENHDDEDCYYMGIDDLTGGGVL